MQTDVVPDALWRRVERTTIAFEWGRLKAAGVNEEAGVNLRVVRNGKVGVVAGLIVYATVIVLEDGLVHFYDDIYGHDGDLEKVLAKGYPYPW